MKTAALLCGAASLVVANLVTAKDFSFEFKTLSADEVMNFPGGYGTYGRLQTKKPAELKKEPDAISKRPLYGQFGVATNENVFLYRLDESKGNAMGYDRLVVDLNQNGDLTDDAVCKPADLPKAPSAMSSDYEQAVFGPIQMPANKKVGPWQPVVFAQMSLYNRKLLSEDSERNLFIGQLRVKSGWYLETLVNLPGVKQKVGLVDGDCNLRLGEPWKSMTYTNEDGVNWYFSPRDSYLVDADKSGRFENNPFGSEYTAVGPVIYLGPLPYRVALAADLKSINVEPWTGPLAELVLKPIGDQVQKLTLASENVPGQWGLMEVDVLKGKAKVPPGTYRFYGCQVEGRAAKLERIRASATKRIFKDTFTAEAGKSMSLTCGAPMEIRVAAAWQPNYVVENGVYRELPPSPTNRVLRINASVVGTAGEGYHTYGIGKDFSKDPPKPVFTVKTPEGKQLLTGNLEYG